MKEFILTGLDAVTMNNDREIITDAAIVVCGERIEAVGKRESVLEEYQYPLVDRSGSGKRMIAEAEGRARDIVRRAGIRVPCPWPVI